MLLSHVTFRAKESDDKGCDGGRRVLVWWQDGVARMHLSLPQLQPGRLSSLFPALLAWHAPVHALLAVQHAQQLCHTQTTGEKIHV
eukprot:COSAG06_NODE_2533_length_6711_cov_6.195705_5_plen_86_part_00